MMRFTKPRTKVAIASASTPWAAPELQTRRIRRRLCHNATVRTFSQCHSRAFSAPHPLDVQRCKGFFQTHQPP